MSVSFASSKYDDHLCVKPPLLLWLAVLYLSRAIVLPLALGIASFAGVNSDAIALFRGVWSPEALLPSLIAVVVLIALIRRVPQASGGVRAIWARGRLLLALAATVDLALALHTAFALPAFDDHTPLSWAAALVDAYFLVYLLAARRVREAFADFPLPHDPPRS